VSKSKTSKAPVAEAPGVQVPPSRPTKLGALVSLLRQDGGATLTEMQAATGWQAHSVRGALSGAIAKRRGLPVRSRVISDQRRYFIEGGE